MHRLNPVQVTLSGKLTRRNSLCQLQIFEAMTRLLSFTRAAEELFLTRPRYRCSSRSWKLIFACRPSRKKALVSRGNKVYRLHVPAGTIAASRSSS